MIQQVQVTSSGPAAIKPLLEAAIRSQLKALGHGIQRTQARLAEFEQRFGLSSADFERDFEAGEIEETLDYIEWAGEIKTLRLLEEQVRALQSAKVR